MHWFLIPRRPYSKLFFVFGGASSKAILFAVHFLVSVGVATSSGRV